MQLGWIDFSKEDRQKAFDVINLLSEQGAVDELGIGVIRDAFANYFFPGTSTIQTRAKYFLIVPYMLREAVDGRYGKDANRVLRAIDSAEKDCGIRLLEADPKAEGVIGSRVLPKGWVARKPSDIYWNGIRTFGIFCDYGLSIPEYVSLAVKLKEQKSVSRLGNRNDDAEEADEKEWIGVFTSSEEMHKGSAGNVQMNQSIESILRLALNWEQVNGIVINPFGKYIQMTKKMIELLINGYEYNENERKSKDDENN